MGLTWHYYQVKSNQSLSLQIQDYQVKNDYELHHQTNSHHFSGINLDFEFLVTKIPRFFATLRVKDKIFPFLDEWHNPCIPLHCVPQTLKYV